MVIYSNTPEPTFSRHIEVLSTNRRCRRKSVTTLLRFILIDQYWTTLWQ